MSNIKQSGITSRFAHPNEPLCFTTQEGEALYQALVASVSDMGQGMMIIQNRRYSYVNEAICNMLGVSAEEMLGWDNFTPAFHPTVREAILAKHLRRLAGEMFDTCYETVFIHRDGHRIDVEVSVAWLRNLQPEGVVVTARDISERKHVEEIIRRKNDDLELLKTSLENKVRERTRELETANRELRRLNQVKSDFISIVSHELRTPLTSIKSFAEIMLDDIDEHSQETLKRYLSIINSESDRLSRLISDILDLQKIDSGNIVWNDEMINLVDIARAAIGLLSSAFRKKGLDLTLDFESEFMMTEAETDRILQVISNVLSNALKFTPAGGINVRLRFIESQYANSKMIQIAISDTGIGIHPEELNHIFERFYQVDNSQSRNHEGAGLGLSICKDIVEHYQGSITVESVLGQGSTFFIALPELKQPRKKLGEVLIDLGMLTEAELSTALTKQGQSQP